MPKLLHEALVELVRDAPAMVLRVLWPKSRELAAKVHVAAGEFVDLNLGHEPGAEYIARAALTAAQDLDRDRDQKYRDFIDAFLGSLALAALEQLMATSKGKNPYFSERFRESYARGEAKMLLKLVALKGFTLTDAERERILGCIDSDVLEEWADRLLTARTLAGMFDGPPATDEP